MTAPNVGDLVRIGGLPAGAVVAWPADGGTPRHVTVTSDRASGGRGRYVERNGETYGWLLDDSLACLVSLPPAAVDAAPVEESAAVAHWHTLAREAEAALYAMTAERDEWKAEALQTDTALDAARVELVRLTVERDAYRLDVAEMVRQLRADVARLTAERDGVARQMIEEAAEAVRCHDRECDRLTKAWSEALKERDDALAQVTALQESAAENGRLRAEIVSRGDSMMCIYEALRLVHTPHESSPAGAVLAIRDLREELIAHAARTQEARDMLAARDAQEGDRIAAWAERSEDVPCARCWYPAPYRLEREKHETLCNECVFDDDDRDAAGAVEVAT